MKILKENPGFPEKVHIFKSVSGITVYAVPKKGYIQKHAMLCVNYGCEKAGSYETAVFLQRVIHNDTNKNAFARLLENGAVPDARVNFNQTFYSIAAVDNFESNLRIMIDMVFRPEFDDGAVSREKAVIQNKSALLSENSSIFSCMSVPEKMRDKRIFHEIPAFGEANAHIEPITAETLMRAHKRFYKPENMALICVGDFDADKLFAAVDEIVLSKKAVPYNDVIDAHEGYYNAFLGGDEGNSLRMLSYIQMPSIFAHKEHMPPSGRKSAAFNIIFPDAAPASSQSAAAAEILLRAFSGKKSGLNLRLFSERLIDGKLSVNYNNYGGSGAIVFSGASSLPERVLDRILLEAERLRQNGMCDAAFHRIRREALSSFMHGLRTPAAIAEKCAGYFFYGSDIVEMFEMMGKTCKSDVLSRLGGISPENAVVSVLRQSAAKRRQQ